MQLRITDYHGVSRWRWELQDDAGNFLADHEVNLDVDAQEYQGYDDPPEYLRTFRAAHGGGPAGDEELLRRLGDWIGEQVFGALRAKFRANITQPATIIRVLVPPEAQDLLFCPFELAHLETGGRPLVEHGIRFIYQHPDAPANPAAKHTAPVLRVLAVFSVPTDVNPLNLRRERYELRKLLLTIARISGVAIEPRILQYGATRETLRDALQEAEGWDVIHLSCHGGKGSLLLETDQGETDEIDAEELRNLILPARDRLRLLTLSACWSGAASHKVARGLLGLDDAQGPTRQEETGQKTQFPSLGQKLARALDCAVLAMRFPVGDKFAADLAVKLYEHMLSHHQPLPAALGLAIQEARADKGARFAPSLSVATPILFGPRAAATVLIPPNQPPEFDLQPTSMFGFPDEPERFVGRLLPMLRATQAFAPGSARRGVLFHGMAGGGKTACALELAYSYQPQGGQRRRFQGYCFHKCPDEGTDIATALVDCLTAIETQLGMPPASLTAVADRPEDFRRRLLPRLTQLLTDNSILIVIDNIESLLTRSGDWRDGKWDAFLRSLLAHKGDSRLVLTSRRLPNTLANHEALLREPIHALSLAESVLLAREMEHLGTYFDSEEGRDLLTKALRVVQGHPELLKQADHLAADRQRFIEQITRTEQDAAGRDAPLAAFFDTGETEQSDENFLDTLFNWTAGLTALLSPTARLLFHCLCRLEDEDRISHVIEANWKDVLTRVKDGVPDAAPALSESDESLPNSLDRLVACGLVGARTIPVEDQSITLYSIHPGVAEAGRAEADPKLLAATDIELGNFHGAVWQHGLKTEMKGGGQLVVQAARSAAPYLLRADRWEEASTLLEKMIHRDRTPATLNWVIPLLRRIVEATRETKEGAENAGVLANALQLASRPDEAETILRDLVAQGEGRGDFRLASGVLGHLVNLLRKAGKLNEALTVAEHGIDLTRKAGLGPWTQLADEGRRLQILGALGRHTEVLEAVEGHRERLKTLPEKSEQDEAVAPWNVREGMLDTGRSAALRSKQWETALRLNAEIVGFKRQRGVDEVEIAKTLFNDYGPLIRLGRLTKAGELLHACRDVFEREHDYEALGKVYSALADLEDKQHHREPAVSLESIALKYTYQSLQPEDCAISHHNLSNYLKRLGASRERWLAHRLAAALIRVQTGSGFLPTTLRNLALSDLPPAPPTFDEVAAAVEKIEGVHFRDLFNRLPEPFPDGDAALAAIWQMIPGAKAELAREEAELEQQNAKRQAVLAELPPAVRKAFDLAGKEFSDALKAALDALPPDERETTLKQLREAGLIGTGPDMADTLRNFDPLLRSIAAVAKGDGTDEDRAQARAEIEQVLPELEENNWRIAVPVQRIFAGERDPAALTADLDANSAALVRRILEHIATA
jgi:hypothetical protein